jgi:hypothetical protein
MTPKQLKSQTERNIRTLLLAVQKPALAIGYRFGDIDQVMVSEADDLVAMVQHWADKQRHYMDECIKEGMWTSL